MTKQNYIRIQSFILALICYVSSTFAIDYTYQKGVGVSCAWSSTDVVGFFTSQGTLLRANYSSSDGKNALVTLSGWSLSANNNYTGFSPYSYYNGVSTSQLPISFENQCQVSNNSLTHLTAFDFMATKGSTTSTNAEFYFSHLASIIRIEWTMTETATLTSLTLTSENSIFTTDAYLNLVTYSLNPQTKSKEYKLNLSNIKIEKSGTLIAYMMIAPSDFSSKTLNLSLKTSEGKTLSTEIKGCKIIAGKTYPIAINGGNTQESESNANTHRTIHKALGASSLAYPLVHIADLPIDAINKFAPIVKGDANGDGKFSIIDIVTTISYMNGITPTNFNMEGADITNDGKIDKADIKALNELLLNK